MSEIPKDFEDLVQKRQTELQQEATDKQKTADEVTAESEHAATEYNIRVRRLVTWAKSIGPLAAAKGIETNTEIVSPDHIRKEHFPVWLLVHELNDGIIDDRLDLSRSPTPVEEISVWSGVVLDRQGLLFYFNNSPELNQILIDDVGPIYPEIVPYMGLESLNDRDGHGQGIEGVENALVDFAARNGIAGNNS